MTMCSCCFSVQDHESWACILLSSRPSSDHGCLWPAKTKTKPVRPSTTRKPPAPKKPSPPAPKSEPEPQEPTDFPPSDPRAPPSEFPDCPRECFCPPSYPNALYCEKPQPQEGSRSSRSAPTTCTYRTTTLTKLLQTPQKLH